MNAGAQEGGDRQEPPHQFAARARLTALLNRLIASVRKALRKAAAGRPEAQLPPAPAGAPPAALSPAAAPAGWKASDSSWRAVIDSLPDPALALDAAGNVAHHNAAVVDIFPRVRVGQPITNVTRSPELLAAVEGERGREGITIVELQDRIPIQRRVSAMISDLRFEVAPVGNPRLLVVFRDITDQEKLAQMRADFIAHASHELRTPLASLRGFVETLQGPARDDPVARERFLGIMATQAARMTRLIDDLLSLSRIEMKIHVPPRGIVDINDVVGFVVQTLEPLAQSAGVTLSFERLSSPARVRGDREELIQAFQNLVQNAIKYNRSGGHVVVRMDRLPPSQHRGERLSVTVEDDGPGIAPEHLPRLTERFYRVSAAASREKGGTGLGLAIVKNVVARHRGELEITSTVGVGSKFRVILDSVDG